MHVTIHSTDYTCILYSDKYPHLVAWVYWSMAILGTQPNNNLNERQPDYNKHKIIICNWYFVSTLYNNVLLYH